MSLKEIISCYVKETIPFEGDFLELKKSFVDNGFKEKKIDANTWRFKRGAGLALEFNYGSESLQMNVF